MSLQGGASSWAPDAVVRPRTCVDRRSACANDRCRHHQLSPRREQRASSKVDLSLAEKTPSGCNGSIAGLRQRPLPGTRFLVAMALRDCPGDRPLSLQTRRRAEKPTQSMTSEKSPTTRIREHFQCRKIPGSPCRRSPGLSAAATRSLARAVAPEAGPPGGRSGPTRRNRRPSPGRAKSASRGMRRSARRSSPPVHHRAGWN